MTKLWDEEPDGAIPGRDYAIDRAIELLEKAVRHGILPEPLEDDIRDYIKKEKQPDG